VLTAFGATMDGVLLTVLAIWMGLAVPAAVFVAALGRSGLREEQARDRVATRTRPRLHTESVAYPPTEQREGAIPAR